jgi:hypothetical protein
VDRMWPHQAPVRRGGLDGLDHPLCLDGSTTQASPRGLNKLDHPRPVVFGGSLSHVAAGELDDHV